MRILFSIIFVFIFKYFKGETMPLLATLGISTRSTHSHCHELRQRPAKITHHQVTAEKKRLNTKPHHYEGFAAIPL